MCCSFSLYSSQTFSKGLFPQPQPFQQLREEHFIFLHRLRLLPRRRGCTHGCHCHPQPLHPLLGDARESQHQAARGPRQGEPSTPGVHYSSTEWSGLKLELWNGRNSGWVFFTLSFILFFKYRGNAETHNLSPFHSLLCVMPFVMKTHRGSNYPSETSIVPKQGLRAGFSCLLLRI